MRDYYRSDLAHIHDTGFGQLGTSAARLIIDELRTVGAPSGLIVELGCGGGLTSRLFCDAGYEVLGVDLSHSLIEIARNRVPEATFRVGTFTTADIPPCIAVTAIGEVFNYTQDPANSPCDPVRNLPPDLSVARSRRSACIRYGGSRSRASGEERVRSFEGGAIMRSRLQALI